MTTPAPKATKKKRSDALVARCTITIPLDTANPDSYANAVKAVSAIEKTLPAGATFKSESAITRV